MDGVTFFNHLQTSVYEEFYECPEAENQPWRRSWEDWGLVMTERQIISPPLTKTVYVEIPGSDGSLDLSEALTGEPEYESRDLSMTFKVIDESRHWSEIYSDILDYLHGQQLFCVFDDDLMYYYRGRFAVDEWESSQRTSVIKITGVVYPYKLELTTSAQDWLWDPFSFESGVIREWANISVNGTAALELPGSRRRSAPIVSVFSVDGKGMDITFISPRAEISYLHLADGPNILPELIFENGVNHMRVEGKGTMTISYQGGRL